MARAIKDVRPRTRDTVSQILPALVYQVILGLDRLEAAPVPRFNGVFQYLTGAAPVPQSDHARLGGARRRAAGVQPAALRRETLTNR